jgi:hypothetical protein
MVFLFADEDLRKMGAEASLDVMRGDWILVLDLIAQVMIMHQSYLPGSTWVFYLH